MTTAAYGIENTFPFYPGLDGQPLQGGSVWFGVAGQNPVTSPQTVYSDAAATQPIAQPIGVANGRTVDAVGNPVSVYVAGDFSRLVQDSLGRQLLFQSSQPPTQSAVQSQNWAQQTGSDVTGAPAGSRSSKSWSQDDLHGATYGGSAKDWAQSSNLPDGTSKSAKSYAGDASTSATNAAGSATASAASATTAQNYAALAATGAKFYNTIALGISGTTSGNTFGVIAGGTDNLAWPTVYRNDAGSATFLYGILAAAGYETIASAAADVTIVDKAASLPSGLAAGKLALVVADVLPLQSTTRSRSNGQTLMAFNGNPGLVTGASVNIRGFGGVGYNGHFTLQGAGSSYVQYRSLTTQSAESTTADTGGTIDRNGMYQYDGTNWSWVADISAAYPVRPASAATTRASAINKDAVHRDEFEQYFAPAFLPKQRICSINEALTLAVESIIPGANERVPVVSVDGSSLGYGTKVGAVYSYPYTAAGAPEYSAALSAVADTRQGTGFLTIAEAVRFSQDLTTWTKTNITSVTGGQADPDGGTNAYRVLCAANGSAVQHFISVTCAPANTGPLVALEEWFRADTASIIAISDGAAAIVLYANLLTGEMQGVSASGAFIERRGPWCKIWFQQRSGSAISTFRAYIVAAVGSLSNTSAGTEAVVMYKPRQADGVLPFFNSQRATIRNGSVGYATRYLSRSDFTDAAASMNTDINVDVVVPDNYTPTKRYPVLYICEVEATPGTSFLDGLQTIKGLGIHNTYQCILVRNYWPSSDVPWFCTKSDGTQQHDVFLRDCVVPFIDKTYSTIRSREGRLLVGFSKSGHGATSLLLRNPGTWGYACAWDVPWGLQFSGTDNYTLDAFGNPSVNDYGQSGAFGTQAQFQLYNPADILAANVSAVNDKCRLVIGGAVSFEGDLTYFRGLLDSSGVPYSFHWTSANIANGPDHNWTPASHVACTWLPQMLAMLFALR